MTERHALIRHQVAYREWEANPSYATAQSLHKAANALVDISDDWQAELDEADDILAEYA